MQCLPDSKLRTERTGSAAHENPPDLLRPTAILLQGRVIAWRVDIDCGFWKKHMDDLVVLKE